MSHFLSLAIDIWPAGKKAQLKDLACCAPKEKELSLNENPIPGKAPFLKEIFCAAKYFCSLFPGACL